MINEAEVKEVIEIPKLGSLKLSLKLLKEWFKNADKCVLQNGIRIDYTEQSKTIYIEFNHN